MVSDLTVGDRLATKDLADPCTGGGTPTIIPGATLSPIAIALTIAAGYTRDAGQQHTCGLRGMLVVDNYLAHFDRVY
jgi:hypothetical protein